ncbi:MAG: hypothetical protein JWM33_3740 [Caulobacteraceae bacterium]|nr:hypothetical protein [Caulobacteraceae bacterium]
MAQVGPYTQTRIARLLQRVLVIDPSVSRGQFLGDLLRNFQCSVRKAPTGASGLALAAQWEPQLIIITHEDDGLDGIAITRALRRSSLTCRCAPVILQLSQPTHAVIVASRNAGVNDFLMHPVSLRDLSRRLEAVLLHPRDWIEAPHYVGPDRRRIQTGEYNGAERRFVRYRMGNAPSGEAHAGP